MKHRKLLLTFFGAGESAGTVINTTTAAELTPEMKEYYKTLLIKLTGPALVHDQFAQKRDIPKNGGKVIEFRKVSPFAKALTPLTEGVTPDGHKMEVTAIKAEVKQYGDFVMLSDVVQLTAVDRLLVEATELNGQQAGETLDTVTREVINAGTNVQYAGGVGGRAAITGDSVMTVNEIMLAVATLKGANAKPVDDSFVCLIHPYVSYDLQRDPEYKDLFKFNNTKPLYTGEVGKFQGVRFVETSEAKIFAAEGADDISVFSTLVIGKNAYGTTTIDGAGLQHIVKPLGSAGSADPLNQRGTAGWKALKTAIILVNAYMVRIESCASKYLTQAAN